MTLMDIRQQALFQTGGDEGDLPDHEPHLTHYINEGYGLLTQALLGRTVAPDGDIAPLSADRSTPEIPAQWHRVLADYAAWMICRNGSTQKQSRGLIFRRAFDDALSHARICAGGRHITHIPM